MNNYQKETLNFVADQIKKAHEEHECFEAQEHIKNCPKCSGINLEEEVSQMHRMDMQDYQEEVKANMDYE